MSKMYEVSRRSMYHEDEGIACGPASITAIDAEIVVDVDGQRIYLHGQWVDAAGDDILFEANTESVYDAYEKFYNAADDDDDEQKALAECDRIGQGRIKDDPCYKSYYAELKQMIIDEMEAHDIEPCFDDEDEDEE